MGIHMFKMPIQDEVDHLQGESVCISKMEKWRDFTS